MWEAHEALGSLQRRLEAPEAGEASRGAAGGAAGRGGVGRAAELPVGAKRLSGHGASAAPLPLHLRAVGVLPKALAREEAGVLLPAPRAHPGQSKTCHDSSS